MNSLLNSHRETDLDDDRPVRRDREITLGTTVVLGIFFALAAICAVFFGFGYSMGRKSAPAANTASTEATSTTLFNRFKPAPGSPLGAAAVVPPPAQTVTVPLNSAPSTATLPTESASPNPEASDFNGAPTSAEPIRNIRPIVSPPVVPAAMTPVAGPPATGQFMVQIAAVSHQEDADTLVTSIGRKGYSVAVHHEPQDKLLHVQIGPFSSRKEADAMRLRIQGDGFNAIVK